VFLDFLGKYMGLVVTVKMLWEMVIKALDYGFEVIWVICSVIFIGSTQTVKDKVETGS